MITRNVRRSDNPSMERKEEPRKTASQEKGTRRKARVPSTPLAVNPKALKRLKLVAVAYSHVEREFFPTQEAYEGEKEVEDRAGQVLQVMEKLGIPGKLYSADEYFLTNLMIDRPDIVLNLVDTLRGKDSLQTSIPGALEMVGIPYTGAGMHGLVIGNDRHLFKQILKANDIPTPDYQFIRRAGTRVDPKLELPLIVKLNEGGGGIGIDNKAVKETHEEAQKRVDELIEHYHLPVIIEPFIEGLEVSSVVIEDSRRKHVFLGQKDFGVKPDGKHEFTSMESYGNSKSYTFVPVQDGELAKKIEGYSTQAFGVLHNKDYAKFDIRVDLKTRTPYFIDCNPNTAFGPAMGLPLTEILDTVYGIRFEKVLSALLSKYAKKIKTSS